MGLFDIFKKKSVEIPSRQALHEIVPNEPALQFVSLFYENKPEIDKDKILAALKTRFENVDSTDNESSLAFFFPDYPVHFAEGSVPAQGAILSIDNAIDLSRFTQAFGQSWHWNEAKEVMKNCKHEINLVDLMSRSLPHQQRLDFFQKFICAVIKATEPSAVYFRNSEKLVEPHDFLKACDNDHPAFLYGAMSVRLFNLGKGEMLMDTLGLHAFGIADFECRFSKYEPGEIAGVLSDIAYYVFDTDDMIRSNTTIQGIGKNPIWQTRYEDSKTEPARLVVNIIPN